MLLKKHRNNDWRGSKNLRVKFSATAALLLSTFALLSCSGNNLTIKESDARKERQSSVKSVLKKNSFGSSILDIGKISPDNPNFGTTSINAVLWQSALETIGFMGIKFISPETGIIITEWFSNEGSENEFQVTAIVNSPNLNSNAISITVAEKTGGSNNSNTALANNLKDAILLKAREKRLLE